MDILTRRRFGLAPRLWRGHLDTADSRRAAVLAGAAAAAQAFVSVIGRSGTGKTTAVLQALRQAGAAIVAPCRPDLPRLHMGDILVALIGDLSQETAYRSGEHRARQARRILGTATEQAVLVIDDAHDLNASTLRALKHLWELGFRGRTPLLGIVLLSETDRTGRVPSVDRRVSKLRFTGLDAAEAAAALRSACGDVLDAAAVERLAAAPQACNWRDLGELVDEALREAAARGERTVSEAAAAAAVDRAAERPEAQEATPVEEPAAAAVDGALARLEAARADGRTRMRPDGSRFEAAS